MTMALILLMASLAGAGETATPAIDGTRTVPAKVVLELKATARVAGDWVLVRDVATVGAETPIRTEEIGAIRLGRVPMAGVERVLSAQELANRMVKLGVTEEIVLAGTVAAITVSAAVKTVSGDELARFGRATLEKRIKWPAEKVHITDPPTVRSITVPDTAYEIRADVRSRRLVGLVNVGVEVISSGKRVAKILMAYRVSVVTAVPRMARSVRAGETITAGDIEESELDIATVGEDVLLKRSDVEGLRAIKTLGEGSLIRRMEVAAPIVVKRGAQVTLLAKIGTVEAKTAGTAKEDGAAEQEISVVNTSSKRTVRARVVDSETVEAVMQ